MKRANATTRSGNPRGTSDLFKTRCAGLAILSCMAAFAAHIHHALDYVEIAVSDFAAAKTFYGNAFGWTFTDYGPWPAYVGIRSAAGDGVEVGGFRLDERVIAGGPLVLLYSSDLDASMREVRIAGGTVIQEPFDFPGGRRFHFRDPDGNELGVWSTSPDG